MRALHWVWLAVVGMLVLVSALGLPGAAPVALAAIGALAAWTAVDDALLRGLAPIDAMALAGVGVCAVWLWGWGGVPCVVAARVLQGMIDDADRHVRLVLAFWLAAVWAVLAHAVPAFEEMFTDLGLDLPLPTVLVINASDIAVGPPALLSVAALAVAHLAWLRRPWLEPCAIVVFGGAVGFALIALMLPLFAQTECVAVGALVATPGGPLAIERVAVGQAVLAPDEAAADGPIGVGTVTAVRRGCVAGVFVLRTDARELRVSAKHPIATRRGWVIARELRVGDELRTRDGWRVLRTIDRRRGLVEVYDLTVERARCFFADGILVHNKLG